MRSGSARFRLNAISEPSLKRRSAFEFVTNSQSPFRSMTALAGYAIVVSGGSTPDWVRPHAGADAHARKKRTCAGACARFMAVRFRPGGGLLGCLLIGVRPTC